MEYYYTDKKNIDIKNNIILFKDFSYRHLVTVLRKKVNDIITSTDGEYNIYKCKILKIDRNLITAKIVNHIKNTDEVKLDVTLFISQLKNSERFEFAVEKAAEIGVNRIYPLITVNTIPKERFSSSRISRMKKIILSAVEQSQRCFLPVFNDSVTFEEMIKLTNESKFKIVMFEFEDSKNKICHSNIKNDCVLLIGPEGGFRNSEIEKLKKNGWYTYSLGNRKLRSETAAILSLYEILRT